MMSLMSSLPPPSPSASPALLTWLNTTLTKVGHKGSSASGWTQAAIQALELKPLQTEASFRQFYRVVGPDTSVVLMNSPPDKERNTAFVSIAQALSAADICVPEVLAHDEPAGWLLLSDLGHTHFIDLYRQGDHARCLQHALLTLERLAPVRHPAIEPYTLARLSDELDIFTEWLVLRACNLKLPEQAFAAARERLLANASDQSQVCVHRDFHCKNLLLIDNPATRHTPEPAQETGVLDFQDALIGPNGYDLASLLHDCYWRFDDRTIDTVVDQVTGVTRKSIDLLAVQRQLKAIGIFTRLALRDNKTSHLQHIEPVLERLIALCRQYQELNALGTWLHQSLRQPALQWIDSMARPL